MSVTNCLVYFLLFFGVSRRDRGSSEAATAKIRRNRIYRFCAATMVVAMSCEGVNAAYWKLVVHREVPSRLLLFVETVCLVAFGISWLVKGEGLPLPGLRDQGQATAVAGPAGSTSA